MWRIIASPLLRHSKATWGETQLHSRKRRRSKRDVVSSRWEILPCADECRRDKRIRYTGYTVPRVCGWIIAVQGFTPLCPKVAPDYVQPIPGCYCMTADSSGSDVTELGPLERLAVEAVSGARRKLGVSSNDYDVVADHRRCCVSPKLGTSCGDSPPVLTRVKALNFGILVPVNTCSTKNKELVFGPYNSSVADTFSKRCY